MKIKINKGWLQLIFGVIGIWAFIFLVIPILTNYGPQKKIIKYTKKQDIDVTPLFYTESELAGEAVLELSNWRLID